MILTFHHSGKYSGTRFTLDEVIQSLSAQREFLRVGAYALAEIDEEIKIDEVRIFLEKLETSS